MGYSGERLTFHFPLRVTFDSKTILELSIFMLSIFFSFIYNVINSICRDFTCLLKIVFSCFLSFEDSDPKTAGKIGSRCAITILTLKETFIVRYGWGLGMRVKPTHILQLLSIHYFTWNSGRSLKYWLEEESAGTFPCFFETAHPLHYAAVYSAVGDGMRPGKEGEGCSQSRGCHCQVGGKKCCCSWYIVTPMQFCAVDLLPEHLLKQLGRTDGPWLTSWPTLGREEATPLSSEAEGGAVWGTRGQRDR